jgi:hypothetical protein
MADEAFAAWLQQGGGPTPRRSERRGVPIYIREFVKRGWRPDFIKSALRSLTNKSTDTWHEREFVESWGLAAVQHVSTPENMRQSLETIGLRPDVAAYLEWMFDPIKDTCYTDKQLLELAVIQRTNPPPHIGGSWPDSTPAPLTWYTFQTTKAINIPGSCSPQQMSLLSELLQPPPDHTLFYHATAWAYADSIQYKLNHSRGRHCLDFGIWPSFYLSEVLDDPLYWGEVSTRRWGNEVAIVVFALPRELPSHFSVCRLEGEEWKRITRQSRMCQQQINEIPELNRCHLVYGPMVYNVKSAEKGRTPITHTPPKMQLASRDDVSDRYLQQHILGCIFFENTTAAT